MALLLGRYWSFVTPAYLFEEMTLEEVRACLGHILRWELHPGSKEHYQLLVRGLQEWIAPTPAGRVRKQDLSWIKGPIGKVIKPHG